MTLLLILCVPLIALVVGRWAWRLHLRALQVLGPGIARQAGVSAPASTTEVVSVMIEDDTVLVGLRSPRPGSARLPDTTFRTAESTLLLSLRSPECGQVARLQRWQASGASV